MKPYLIGRGLLRKRDARNGFSWWIDTIKNKSSRKTDKHKYIANDMKANEDEYQVSPAEQLERMMDNCGCAECIRLYNETK